MSITAEMVGLLFKTLQKMCMVMKACKTVEEATLQCLILSKKVLCWEVIPGISSFAKMLVRAVGKSFAKCLDISPLSQKATVVPLLSLIDRDGIKRCLITQHSYKALLDTLTSHVDISALCQGVPVRCSVLIKLHQGPGMRLHVQPLLFACVCDMNKLVGLQEDVDGTTGELRSIQ